MPSWGKKTVSFLWVCSLLGQDCSCDRRFGEENSEEKAHTAFAKLRFHVIERKRGEAGRSRDEWQIRASIRKRRCLRRTRTVPFGYTRMASTISSTLATPAPLSKPRNRMLQSFPNPRFLYFSLSLKCKRCIFFSGMLIMNFLATTIQCTLAAIVISAVIGLVRIPLYKEGLISCSTSM